MYALGNGSVVAVPMLNEEDALGVIYADVSQLRPPFERRGVALLTLVANYAAMAITQNRPLARIQREERQRQRLEGYFAAAVVRQILESDGADDFASAKECDATVLFCDMVGFTSFSERCGPHQVLNLLNRYFGEMTEAIFRHEGTLDKFIGDCMMCVFGAPMAQADHARRAACAALELRAAVERLAPREAGARLDFRMGMSSGKVVAGNLGHARRREWTVLGSTVNLASRMESEVARPGQIVLTEFTRSLLGEEFDLRRLPSHTPKGFTREVELYELLGPRAATA
jgi:adenylate cyclase